VWSLVHIDDAASATVAAIEHGAPGIYNVVDDAPAPVRELLPGIAAAVGAPPPRHLPGWVVRLAAGPQALSMMTRVRGASNAKAKRTLGWAVVNTGLFALGWTVTTAGGIDVSQQWAIFGAFGCTTLAFVQSMIIDWFVPRPVVTS